MPSLQEKIEQNAAQQLVLPAGRKPAQELARYKTFLKVETHRLKILHRGGGGGRKVCQARAAIMDELLRRLLDSVKSSSPILSQTISHPIALVAIGGYGRAELNPYSDIDFMFLHNGEGTARGRSNPYLAALTEGFLYPLWDIGLKVGHSVRSVSECVQAANTDMQSKTSLIEARLISGNSALFKIFQQTLLDKSVRGHEDAYIEARVEDQASRHAKYGNSATMQEPNVKNGCGGLRDYQNLHWMAFFKYRTRTTSELEARGPISAAEARQLEAAYDFLLRVRNELHYTSGRAVDVLSKSLQPTVATNLGYSDRSPTRRIEAFMRDFYTHSRNVFLITRTVEQRLALLPPQKKLLSLGRILGRRRTPQTLDGFIVGPTALEPANARIFREQPRRLMRVFLHMQQRGLTLTPDLDHLIRNQLHLVDRQFLQDEHVQETFLEILKQRGSVARILRAMHEVGFLGKYIPEFGKLTCLVQHEFYHQYTADEHTLVCLEKLDRIWESQEEPYSHYAQLFREVERPFILYLALLLHDSGKAQSEGDHSETGCRLALKVARRLHLDGSTTHILRVLIEHHLTMAQISQRRDLDDPEVILGFANQVQTAENLTMLTLHSFADAMGTSANLWNGFKDTLLLTLHRKTMGVLNGEAFLRAEEKQRELLEAELRRTVTRNIADDELHSHFTSLPARYFQIHSAEEIATDLGLVHRFMQQQMAVEDTALHPVIHWHNEPDRGYTSLKICTWDRSGLFSKIAGSMSAVAINILSAQILTRTDGIVIDTFLVCDARTGKLVKKEERERFEPLLIKVLMPDGPDLSALIARQKFSRTHVGLDGARIQTWVRFEDSVEHSIIEIETEDTLGLLYTITEMLAELELDVAVAKILTERGAAIDSFYVSEADGSKIAAGARQEQIRTRLEKAIHGLIQK